MSDTHHPNYVKIWGILCVLLVISVLGPLLEIRVITLITAFGIAIVKAYIVAKNFMHVNVQPRYVGYLLGTALALMLLFFSGVAPDVMKDEGSGWVKPSYAYHDRVGSDPDHAKDEGHH
jgi:caa(3)-type oxidase subunit IV